MPVNQTFRRLGHVCCLRWSVSGVSVYGRVAYQQQWKLPVEGTASSISIVRGIDSWFDLVECGGVTTRFVIPS